MTIRKHENVFADVSALHYRPWQLYNSLMLAQEYGVWPKLLFGTDYPYRTAGETTQMLRECGCLDEAALRAIDCENAWRLLPRWRPKD